MSEIYAQYGNHLGATGCIHFADPHFIMDKEKTDGQESPRAVCISPIRFTQKVSVALYPTIDMSPSNPVLTES